MSCPSISMLPSFTNNLLDHLIGPHALLNIAIPLAAIFLKSALRSVWELDNEDAEPVLEDELLEIGFLSTDD